MGAGGVQVVGRDSERELVASTLRSVADGRPCALLIAGEPGIGKTSLVADVTSGPEAAGHQVLWGRCLRFGAASSPYPPIVQMLTQWHRRADESERARVLAGAEHLTAIAQARGPPPGPAEPGRVLPLVATGPGAGVGRGSPDDRGRRRAVGRAYAEIAQALFISEKTVSVHVSNLLRKTGTTRHIELADLARRSSDLPDA